MLLEVLIVILKTDVNSAIQILHLGACFLREMASGGVPISNLMMPNCLHL
jgi:hypothetical protein